MAQVRPLTVLLTLLLLPTQALAAPPTEAGRLYAAGDAAGALKKLAAATSPEARLLRARALLDTGAHKEAALHLKGLHQRLHLVGDLVLMMRGEALLRGKQHRAAAAAFRAAIRWKGSRFEDRARLGLARALAVAGRWRAAVKAYGRLLHLYPEHPERPAVELAMVQAMERTGWRAQAAVRYQEIWLRWPWTPAANEARKGLARLRRRGVKLEPASWSKRLIRVRKLRRHKLYPETLAEIALLRKLYRRDTARRRVLDMELARTHLRTGDEAKALPLLQALYVLRGRTASTDLKWKLAKCLADLGRLDEARRMLMKGATHEVGRGRKRRLRVLTSRVGDARRVVTLLAWHGRYAPALALMDRFPGQLARTTEQRQRRTWLAHRCGKHDRAIAGFEQLMKRNRVSRALGLYWQARAHQRAGRAGKAEAHYRELLQKHPRTYYGILARSRLNEAGKLKLKGATCGGAPRKAPSHDQVAAQLAALTASHGKLLPDLRRAKLLWQLGLTTEARRELRLLAVELLWARYRGRHRRWIIRPSLERIWRGAAVRPRRWDRRGRALHKEGQPLRAAVGKAARDAGVFYLGWRLGSTGKDPADYRFPRAYARLVEAETGKHRLDPNMLWAIMRTESAYRPDAVSAVDATGLMQIMPYTGRLISQAMKLKGHKHHMLFEPSHNLRMSGWYLRQVMDKFNDQVPLVAAAYNGGPHRVARWLKRRGRGMMMDEFIEEIPFRQSRLYAKKVIRLVALYQRVHCGKDDMVLANKLVTSYKKFPTF